MTAVSGRVASRPIAPKDRCVESVLQRPRSSAWAWHADGVANPMSVMDNLPFVDQCCLVLTKINLILRAIGGVDNRLDGCVYEFTRVHVDFDQEALGKAQSASKEDFRLIVGQ
jgi:hypothetical protein